MEGRTGGGGREGGPATGKDMNQHSNNNNNMSEQALQEVTLIEPNPDFHDKVFPARRTVASSLNQSPGSKLSGQTTID